MQGVDFLPPDLYAQTQTQSTNYSDRVSQLKSQLPVIPHYYRSNNPVGATSLPLACRIQKENDINHYPPFTFGEISFDEADNILLSKPVGSWLVFYSPDADIHKTVVVSRHLQEDGKSVIEHIGIDMGSPLIKYEELMSIDYNKHLFIVPEAFTRSVQNKKQKIISRICRIFGKNNNENKSLNENYYSEFIDPKHRYGLDLNQIFRVWKESSSRLGFNAWMQRLEAHEYVSGIESLISKKFFSTQNGLIHISRVVYVNPLNQMNNLMKLGDRGTISTNNLGVIYDTHYKYPHIFVIDSDHNIFIAKYEAKKFSHASLLAGRPVISAGELVFANGKLRKITDKSGHYHTTPLMLLKALNIFSSKGVDLTTVMVTVFSKYVDLKPQSFLAAVYNKFSKEKVQTIWDNAEKKQLDHPESWGNLDGAKANEILACGLPGTSLIRYSRIDKCLKISYVDSNLDIFHLPLDEATEDLLQFCAPYKRFLPPTPTN